MSVAFVLFFFVSDPLQSLDHCCTPSLWLKKTIIHTCELALILLLCCIYKKTKTEFVCYLFFCSPFLFSFLFSSSVLLIHSSALLRSVKVFLFSCFFSLPHSRLATSIFTSSLLVSSRLLSSRLCCALLCFLCPCLSVTLALRCCDSSNTLLGLGAP